MQDAVVLANCLYEMKGLTPDDIDAALSEFKTERFVKVKAQFEASKMNAKVIYGQVRHPHFLNKKIHRFCDLLSSLNNNNLTPPLHFFLLSSLQKSLFERMLRTIVFNWLPTSVHVKGGYKGVEFRPQASFLPQVPVRGTGPVLPQKPSQRYQNEQAELKGEEQQTPVAV